MLKKIIMLILAAFCAMVVYCAFQIVKMDLFEYAPKAPVTHDYDLFIDEFISRIGE